MTNLSNRELEVLSLVANGQRRAAIASHLGISVSTVKTHVTSIYRKTGAGTLAQAVYMMYHLIRPQTSKEDVDYIIRLKR